MQNKRKIINDPVLGFISIPSELLYDIIQHPLFSKAQQDKTTGNVIHGLSRSSTHHFLHSIRPMHLMEEALNQLKGKA